MPHEHLSTMGGRRDPRTPLPGKLFRRGWHRSFKLPIHSSWTFSPACYDSFVPKHRHEFRDPIHTFITVSSDERAVIDSRPFQRLRHIHQLAMTYLVYPGATHRRFEHSLGVMELSGRLFDVITSDHNRRAHELEIAPKEKLSYWRTVVRMGALCHDLGHIPFSHGAEDLLPAGYHHENLSYDIIMSDEMKDIFHNRMTPPLRPEDVAKVAVGTKHWPASPSDFNPWEELMTEIVTGDAFGVDRIDYLLRDSLHTGVAYGRFDHHRLIDTLRILEDPSGKAVIGIEEGGIHTAEALQLARYFMFEQLYFHPVRRAFDRHLRTFLEEWLPDGHYPTDLERHLGLTDNEVLAAMRTAADDAAAHGHVPARRILRRQFYRVLYKKRAEDQEINPNAVELVHRRAVEEFGKDSVDRDTLPPKDEPVTLQFLVERKDLSITSSLQESQVLGNIPAASFDYVFVVPEKLDDAKRWLEDNLRGILGEPMEGE
jgi:uncharacterized protein